MGCQADREPGQTAAKKAGAGYRDMKSGRKALMIAGSVPDGDFKSDFTVVLASHLTGLAEKADVVLPSTALYERQGTIIDTYGKIKTINAAQTVAGEAKDGADIISELSQLISKTKGFKPKDAASGAKKVKTGKLLAASFKPVAAKAVKSAHQSTSALLSAMNQGMLSGSAVSKVLMVTQPVLQK